MVVDDDAIEKKGTSSSGGGGGGDDNRHYHNSMMTVSTISSATSTATGSTSTTSAGSVSAAVSAVSSKTKRVVAAITSKAVTVGTTVPTKLIPAVGRHRFVRGTNHHSDSDAHDQDLSQQGDDKEIPVHDHATGKPPAVDQNLTSKERGMEHVEETECQELISKSEQSTSTKHAVAFAKQSESAKTSKSNPTEAVEGRKSEIRVAENKNGFLSVWTHTSMWVSIAVIVALYSTYLHWTIIVATQNVPLSVVVIWLVVAWATGHAMGMQRIESLLVRHHDMRAEDEDEEDDRAAFLSCHDLDMLNEPPTSSVRVLDEMNDQFQRHRLLSWSRALKTAFSRKDGLQGRSDSSRSTGSNMPYSSSTRRSPRPAVWTSLSMKDPKELPNHRHLRLPRWQRQADPTRDSQPRLLMRELLQNKRYRRVRHRFHVTKPGHAADDAIMGEASVTSVAMDESLEVDELTASHSIDTKESTEVGQIDMTGTHADTLECIVVKPFCSLRGMDILLSDNPENWVSDHPYLISQTLRDVPTFVINVLTAWGNLLIYLEMPTWVKDWDAIVEQDHDEEEEKAIKRFLNGDDQYRNERLKLIPSIVDGPLAVRLLAPPKKELMVHGAVLPVSWKKFPAETAPDGRKLCPCIEAELDCMSNRAMRGMASIIKTHLQKLSIDVAVVIGKPVKQEQEEPQACVGLWRFNHIDIATCPYMPDRYTAEAAKHGHSPDVVRASMMMQVPLSSVHDHVAER